MNYIQLRIIFIALFITSLLSFEGLAQSGGSLWEKEIRIGINVGGTTPIPLPAEIRKIRSFSTGLNPLIAIRTTRWIENYRNWGITTGFSIDYKGMKESADVKHWYTYLEVGEGSNRGTFSGTFSGRNETTIKNGYFTIPLLATYRPFASWTFHAGGFASLMHSSKFSGQASDGYIRDGGPTGDKIEIKSAKFDFSGEIRKFDAGLSLGADLLFNHRLSAIGELNWSFIPLFKSDFRGVTHNMYNVYFNLGLSYRI